MLCRISACYNCEQLNMLDEIMLGRGVGASQEWSVVTAAFHNFHTLQTSLKLAREHIKSGHKSIVVLESRSTSVTDKGTQTSAEGSSVVRRCSAYHAVRYEKYILSLVVTNLLACMHRHLGMWYALSC